MAAIDGTAAAEVMRGFRDLAPGMCLHYVWQAYKAVGASTGRSAGTAAIGWDRTDGRHPGDRNPPRGVPVWWGNRYDGNTAGDVVISLGDGRVICTDYPTWGRIGICTIDEREEQIGRTYLGWSECIFDQPIQLPHADAESSTTTPLEDNMKDATLVRWNNQHVFAIGRESVYHVPNPTEHARAEVFLGKTIEVDNDGLTTALRLAGVHWAAVDAVLRGVGYQDGGKYWSRQIAEGEAIRGGQVAAAKTLADVLATAKALTQ